MLCSTAFCPDKHEVVRGVDPGGGDWGSYLFIYYEKSYTKYRQKIKTKGRKTKANPYGSSLHAAQ